MASVTPKVAVEALPEVKLGVRPEPVVVDAAGGRDQRLVAAFENRGNVALTLDLDGVYPLFEETHAGPARATDAGRSLGGVLGRLLEPRPLPVLTPAGTVELSMCDGPLALAPGASMTAEVSLRLPDGLDPTIRYHVFAPLYASDLHIVIVTAAKPRVAAGLARPARGAAA